MYRFAVAAVALGAVTSIHAQIIGDPQPISPATTTAVASVVVTASADSSSAVPVSSIDNSDGSVTLFQDLAGTSTAVTAATPSVISIFFPGADALPYVGAVIGGDSNAQVIAISCGPGVDSDTCGFPSSVTVTAGPSTAYVSVSNEEATFIYDCKITGSTAAVCAETFNGNFAYIATSSGTAAASGQTSSVLTETLGSKDIKWMPITITGKAADMPKPAKTPAGAAPAASSGAAWKPDAGASAPAAGTPAVPVPAPASSGSAPSYTLDSGVSFLPGATTPVAAPVGTNANPVSVWTGGASRQLAAVGNYAAGLLALANLVL